MRLRPTWSALPPSAPMTQPSASAHIVLRQRSIDLAQRVPLRQQIHGCDTLARRWSHCPRRCWMLQFVRQHSKNIAFAGLCAIMRRLIVACHVTGCPPLTAPAIAVLWREHESGLLPMSERLSRRFCEPHLPSAIA